MIRETTASLLGFPMLMLYHGARGFPDVTPPAIDLPPVAIETLISRPEPLVFELLASGLSVEITVTGSSMSPGIRSLDAVTLAPIGDRRIRLGDVVALARPDGRLVIHRVVTLENARLRTRGDAASAADPWIDRESLVGRVERIDRRGRPARWGLGPARPLIACLSRAGLLAPLLRLVRWL